MPRKPKNSDSKRQPPLTPDQVVKWDNIINGKHPPKELRTLKSSNSLVISKHIHDFKPENALRKIDIGEDVSAWNLLPGHDLVFGLPLKTGGRLSQEELAYSKPAGGHLEAYRPEWADVIYHPKLSGGIFRKRNAPPQRPPRLATFHFRTRFPSTLLPCGLSEPVHWQAFRLDRSIKP